MRFMYPALAAFLLGSGPSSCGTDLAPGSVAVNVVNNAFDPTLVTVPAGSGVSWVFMTEGLVHNVTFEDGVASGPRTGGSYVREFMATGIYRYRCTVHSDDFTTGMVGEVEVQ